jgi:hypothetical protein
MRKITEILDNPLPFEVQSTTNQHQYEAYFEIDGLTYIFSAEMLFGSWQLAFAPDDESLNKLGIDYDDRYEILNTGNAFSIFATVGAIIEDWADRYSPERFDFSGMGRSRAKLYAIFAQKIAQKLNYKLEAEQLSSNIIMFKFEKK